MLFAYLDGFAGLSTAASDTQIILVDLLKTDQARFGVMLIERGHELGCPALPKERPSSGPVGALTGGG
jgi:hypothetical protein